MWYHISIIAILQMGELRPKGMISLAQAIQWEAAQLMLQLSSYSAESHSVVSDSLQPHELYNPYNSPGQNTRVGSRSVLQGIFPTQGSNPGLPYCRWIPYQLSHKGSPRILEWVAYPFSSGSSWPRNQTSVSCAAGGFFSNWAIWEAHSAKAQFYHYTILFFVFFKAFDYYS